MKKQSGQLLFIDGSAGASGDMLLGALVDLGVPAAHLRRALKTLPVTGWTLRSRSIVRCSLAARKIDIAIKGAEHGRGLKALKKILQAGELSSAVRKRSLAVFQRLLEAEAEAHGLPVEKVHLHEAGGTDAIVDVVGTCLGIEYLEPSRIVVSRVTTGFGSIDCAHGRYPVPAPATLLLMRGYPVQAGEIETERLTPTGAALLTTLADEWGEFPAMRPLAVGYGAGDRDLGETPNFLRMILGRPEPRESAAGELAPAEINVIECTLDELSAQTLAYTAERLLEAGALDVFITPVLMKKGRPGHNLTVLTRARELPAAVEMILSETASLGLRYRTERRVELERAVHKVKTRFGPVRIKVGKLGAGKLRAWPEYEDCAALARRKKVALAEVQREALAAFQKSRSSKKS